LRLLIFIVSQSFPDAGKT